MIGGGACTQLIGIEPWQASTSGGGGSDAGIGGASSSSSSSSSQASASASSSSSGCMCPMPASECQAYLCPGGVCTLTGKPFGTITVGQKPGDCLRQVCDGDGGTAQVMDNTDKPADQGCGIGACANGPIFTPKPAGTICGAGATCNSMGVCQPCMMTSQCMNGCTDLGETDTDCGGSMCPQCGAGKHCLKDIDCFSNKCLANFTCM